MKRYQRVLLLLILAVVLVGVWLLWWQPTKIDMSAFAPADALLYVEADDPLAVVQALVGTDAWRLTRAHEKNNWSNAQSGWLRKFFKTTGIGPIQSVVLSRAQVAIVVTDLGTVEEGDTLTVKPEVALIIETHTSQSRIRNPAEQTLKALAESTYTNPTLRRTFINGIEFVEWRSQEGSRQIVFTILNSLIVVGNSEKAVQRCLETAAGRAPSLKADPTLQLLRRNLGSTDSLTFGYVPSERSADLLSVAVPLLLGRAPGDAGFQKIVATGAAKIFGSIGWSSRPFRSGIEDRFLISLQPSFLTQLKPTLQTASTSRKDDHLIPDSSYSVTFYHLRDPLAAWEGLRTAVTANIDALSAVVFSSLLKSALVSYGISEPAGFLRSVTGEINTVRLDSDGEHSLLIAGVKDYAALREVLTSSLKYKLAATPGIEAAQEMFVNSTGEMGASLDHEIVVVGTVSDLRKYHERTVQADSEQFKRMTFFTDPSNTGPIVTYTDDSERVRRFNSALNSVAGSLQTEPPNFDQALSQLPYAATETKLVDRGFERTTRSPLGQFSTLLPLIIPTDAKRAKP